MSFYDFDEYERLVAAASSVDATAHLIVLLGGEAGLRCGEMIAIEWRDVDSASGRSDDLNGDNLFLSAGARSASRRMQQHEPRKTP
jgi:hypothetical protein